MYTFPKRLVTCGSAQRNAPLNLYATTTGRLCLLKKIKTRVFRTVSAAFDSMVQQKRGGVGKWDAAYQHTPISSSNFKGVLPHQPKVWGQIPEKKGHDFRNCASRRGLSPGCNVDMILREIERGHSCCCEKRSVSAFWRYCVDAGWTFEGNVTVFGWTEACFGDETW